MTKKQKKRMQELAAIAYERDLSNCLGMLYDEFARWKKGQLSAWDMAAAVHEFHTDVAVTLYKTYSFEDPVFAVAAGVHLGTLAPDEVDDWCQPLIEPILTLLERGGDEPETAAKAVPKQRDKSTGKSITGKKSTARDEQAVRAPVEALRQIYQLKVTLNGVRPAVWRRILVPSTISLPDLHVVLQIAMGWSDRHLHQFVANGRIYGSPDPDFGGKLTDERGVRLSQLMREDKDTLDYLYDFGDGWEHKIVLEKVLPFDAKTHLPVCLSGKRACPPEDVGGPPGYAGFLRAIRDPQHPDHEHYLEWIGATFDAEYFDSDDVNRTFGG